MDLGPKFGESLHRFRLRRDLTRSALGKALGVTERSVGNWERGDKFPGTGRFSVLVSTLRLSKTEAEELMMQLIRERREGAQS